MSGDVTALAGSDEELILWEKEEEEEEEEEVDDVGKDVDGFDNGFDDKKMEKPPRDTMIGLTTPIRE